MENPKTGMPIKYKFFARIFIATFLGWAVPHIVYRILQLTAGSFSFTFGINSLFVLGLFTLGLMLFLTSGSLIGFWISLAQWIALRSYIKSFWLWMISLVFIWIAGQILGYVIILIQSVTIPYSHFGAEFSHSTLLRLVCVGLATGFFVGLLQQTFLQKRTGIRYWWGVAGLFGVFGGIFFEGANAAATLHYVTIDPIYASILAGLVFAGFASLPALLIKPPDITDRIVSPPIENAIP